MSGHGNLLPAIRVQRRRHRHLCQTWLVSVGAYTLTSTLALIAATFALRPSEAIGGDLSRARETAKTQEARLVDLRQALEDANATLNATRLVEHQADWSILLTVLAETLGDDIVLKRCLLDSVSDAARSAGAIAAEDLTYVVDIRGFGKTQTAVSQFVLRLERTTIFSHVVLEESNREAFLTDHAIAFRLRCVLAGEEASP